MVVGRHARVAIPVRSDHGEIRRNNLEVILRHLALLGPASRAGLAQRAGLTRATVSRLVAELIELGLVREVGVEQTGSSGRPGTRLDLDGRHLLAVGGEVNIDSLTVVLADPAGQLLYERRTSVDTASLGPEGTVAALASEFHRAVSSLEPRDTGRTLRVAGVGVAVPGLVDVTQLAVSAAPNLHWHEFPLGDALRDQLGWDGVPMAIGNDANFAAQAEYWMGPYAGAPNLVFVTGDVGIGGGMIVEGKLLLGPRGHAGEVGHMMVDPDGPLCGCGRNGCWESLIGQAAFVSSLRSTLGPEVALDTAMGLVAERAVRGDPAVRSAIDRLGYWVGMGAANLVNLLGTEVIVLGGYFGAIGDWVLPAAREVLRRQVMPEDARGCLLVTSTLGWRAAAAGGALQAIDQLLSDPTVLHDAPLSAPAPLAKPVVPARRRHQPVGAARPGISQ